MIYSLIVNNMGPTCDVYTIYTLTIMYLYWKDIVM